MLQREGGGGGFCVVGQVRLLQNATRRGQLKKSTPKLETGGEGDCYFHCGEYG